MTRFLRGMMLALTLLALAATAPVLTGCGKKSSLDAPPGTTYPRKYPTL